MHRVVVRVWCGDTGGRKTGLKCGVIRLSLELVVGIEKEGWRREREMTYLPIYESLRDFTMRQKERINEGKK